MPKPSKKLFIKSYGCQMNVYDAGRMSDILIGQGFGVTDRLDDADLVILNTCHIREKAEDKVYSDLGRIRRHKQARQERGENTIVSVAGCVAQAEGEEILHRAPVVDLVFGPQTYHRLPELVNAVQKDGARLVDTDFPVEDKFAHLDGVKHKTPLARGAQAFVTVQEGCDKFCTFCVVPYTRGAEISRAPEAIVDEVHALVDAGVREITLLGQNVNAYHGVRADGGQTNLAGLLAELAECGGLARLRYTTSHPRDMDDDLIRAHSDNPKLMPYLHLPVQSGSDRILEAMNRKHGRVHYLRLIERIRKVRPDIAVSGDFIVGFPGESDADFEATLELVREVEYAQAYSFKYSARPGTPAADRDEQVEDQIKAARLAQLQELLNSQQAAFNARAVGRRLPVLADRTGRKPGQLAGRTPYLQAAHFDAPEDMIGRIVELEIERVNANSLSGRLTGNAGARRLRHVEELAR
jgi:tRNA-2-methylthio-N6-dimethylallyladenosine synthase